MRKVTRPFTVFEIATELNLDVSERYQFITAGKEEQQKFIRMKLMYQHQLLEREEKSRNVFHLN